MNHRAAAAHELGGGRPFPEFRGWRRCHEGSPRRSRLPLLPRHRRVRFFVLKATSAEAAAAPEQRGGKMVVELVGAFNQLTGRMNSVLSTSSSSLLFKSLKLSIPMLQSLPLSTDGRSPLSKALSVALLLADLQVSLPPTHPPSFFKCEGSPNPVAFCELGLRQC